MFPHVEDCYFYKRTNNTIIACKTNGDEVPLVRLKQNFPDILILEGQAYDYMVKYMEIHPHLWEYVKKEPKLNDQLTLF
jgi:hypothetical protein